MSEMEKILVVDEKGIRYLTTTNLTVFQILQLQKTLQTRILHRKTRIQDLTIQVNRAEKELINAQSELQKLLTPQVKDYIKVELEKRQRAFEKAQQLLCEYIGEEQYQLLQSKGYLKTTQNNMVYKLDKNGNLYRKENKEYKKLCVIRPQYLPLPDFIISLLTTLREKPQTFKRHARR
jgi:hypothetical protein